MSEVGAPRTGERERGSSAAGTYSMPRSFHSKASTTTTTKNEDDEPTPKAGTYRPIYIHIHVAKGVGGSDAGRLVDA